MIGLDDLLRPLQPWRMALSLPCGDGAQLAAWRELGLPAVGLDRDAAAVQRSRAQELLAFAGSWRALRAQRQKFDVAAVDLAALGHDFAAADWPELAAILAHALLPGGTALVRAAAALATDVPLPPFARLTQLAPDVFAIQRAPAAPPPAITPPPLRVLPYAALFVGHGPVLELGGGSGRFLDALAVHDVRACGSEQDPALAAAARARGHTIAIAGLDAALAHAGACGGVFVGHVAARLAEPHVPLLLAAARHALRPGGRLVVRAPRDAAIFAAIERQASAHGFGVARTSRVPGDADDAVLVALATAPSRVPPPTPAQLAAVPLPTSDLPLERPPRSPFDLERSERRVHSQGGEDGVLDALFATFGATDRRYVEFGCGDGLQCNTAALRRQGWRGLLLDGECKPGAPDAAIHAAWITKDNINALFDAHAVPQEPDLLSIDVDGNDWWIWQAITRRPRIVIAEYNANLGPDDALTIPYDAQHRWNGTDFYGASLQALVQLGRQKGYSLVYCTMAGVNAFFVRDDLLAGMPTPDARALYRPPNYWYRGVRQPPDLSRAMQAP